MRMKNHKMSGIRTFIPNDSNTNKQNIKALWDLRIHELVDLFNTNTEKGISSQEAQKRRKKSGLNLLYPEFKRTFYSAFLDHIKAVFSVLLSASLFVYFAFFGEIEFLFSAAIVTLSILFDCVMEHISSRKLSKSRKNASLKALVKRNGTFYSIDSRYLVPGDIVYVKKGSIVPADIRLFESNGLTVFETPINGIEHPIQKVAKEIFNEVDYTKETPVNMIYAGSIVELGSGWGIVCFVGNETKFTTIPKNKHNNVPSIFKYVYSVSSMLSIISSFFGALMLIGGIFFSASLSNTFLFALTIASCSLCDGIVSFSSLAFSKGLSEMEKNGAVLRNLSSVEPICFIDSLVAHQNTLFPVQKTEVDKCFLGQYQADEEQERKLIQYFLLCSDVKKSLNKNENKLSSFYGKQNAVAAAIYGESIDVTLESCQKDFLVTESTFRENDDFSSLLAYEKGQKYLFVKGLALDVIDMCKYHITPHGVKTLSDDDFSDYRNFISLNTNETGYLIALAKCETAIDKLSEYEDRKVLTLCGFIRFKTYFGIDYFKDVSDLHRASIEVCMFSSDSYMKAYNLGKNSGIFNKNNQIISTEELGYISKDEFEENLPMYRLFLNFPSSLFNKIVLKKKQNKKIVAVTAESTDDLLTMKNSNVSFVVDGESSEMIKQSSDVILSNGGFDKINNVIFISKKIYRRIHSLCEYSVYNYISLAFMYLLGAIFGLEYRVHDFLLLSVLISGIICLYLSIVPIQPKDNFERPMKRKRYVSLQAFKTSASLGIMCALCCVILGLIFKGNSHYSVSLISFTFFSFFASTIILNEGKTFTKQFFGLNLYSLIMLGVLIISDISIIALSTLSNFLSYEVVSLSAGIFSVGIPIALFLFYPFINKTLHNLKKVRA